jgi:hypothetical protein
VNTADTKDLQGDLQSQVKTDAVGGHEERHEVKFAAYAHSYANVRHWLRMHSVGFVTPYPARRVNNAYFDTYDYRAYAENLAGVSERSKVRLRWYGDVVAPSTGVLEVKQKRNHFGWKLRYPIAEAPWGASATWQQIRLSMRQQLPLDGRVWLDHNPMPVLINRYSREYFVTADGRVRATIDREQSVYDQRYRAAPNLSRPGIMQDTLVLEIKFSRADRQFAVGLLADVPIRVGRHSKFMNGLRSIGLV